jgi:large subunit ribosomal protein L15e
MGYLKYIRDLWKQPKKNLGELWKEHLIEFRQEPATLRVPKPIRIDRARSIGYKAKKGFVVVRQRVTRGGKQREFLNRRGRRSKHYRHKKVNDKNYQQIAEERANKAFPNLEVLGSYYLAEDGQNYWYEIILVDSQAPEIKADKSVSWISSNKHRGRVFRGLTSAGRKSRGLRNKGKGAEKLRPSRKAYFNHSK